MKRIFAGFIFFWLVTYGLLHVPRYTLARAAGIQVEYRKSVDSTLPPEGKYPLSSNLVVHRQAQENFKIISTRPDTPEFTLRVDKLTGARKGGYLTHPDDGSYFIWYPVLGNEVAFFDAQGQFLWKRKDSHYLASSPSGDYILGVAGDESRVFILNPTLEPLTDSEGWLLVERRFDSGNDSRACAVFAGGSIRLLDGKSRKSDGRQTTGFIKSAYCDFRANGALLLNYHVKNSTDVLKFCPFDSAKDCEEIDVFKRNWPGKLPLASNDRFYFILRPDFATQDFQAKWYARESKEPLAAFETIAFLKDEDFERLRVLVLENSVILYGDRTFLLMDPNGVQVHLEIPSLLEVRKLKNTLFIQSTNDLIFMKVMG